MTALRRSLLAALKSFLRGKSFLQALFAYWINPKSLRERHVKDGMEEDGRDLDMTTPRSLEGFLTEAERLLLDPIEGDRLRRFSLDLKAQFRERLLTHPECMLPSFNHLLPSGKEKGQYVALDVGGSTLRVALVELRGRGASGRESEIVRLICFKISPEIKKLEGMAFFDWMASRINEVITKHSSQKQKRPIPIGMSWSFPVEQLSLGSGLLIGMGKGFLATNGLLNQDLGEIIKFACKKQGLDVTLEALINDGSATLLSQAYIHANTRFGLILGTGVNVAVYLPVSAVGRQKYGARPESWFKSASHVIINTELGMFGHGILPLTRWDELLNAGHPRPDFQPLEHFLSGFYLGEICRHAIVEAVETAGLFGGQLPPSLASQNSLDTELLSRIEADTSPELDKALSAFTAAHPPASPSTPITTSDISFIRTLSSFLSRRSAALLAASVFSLWQLRHETEAEYLATTPAVNGLTPLVAEMEAEHAMRCTKVAFNGSVIEHYPSYRSNCQNYLDDLVSGTCDKDSIRSSSGKDTEKVLLVPTIESSILGAAVALGCATAPVE